MERIEKILLFTGITFILFFGIGLVYADEGTCPKLSNYVNHTYYIYDDKENNFVEFDISASKQTVPVYIYIDKPLIQQMFVLNLTHKDKNGRYFDHVRLNLKDTTVAEIYLNKPGIHTLLITTDPHYYREDISNLCLPQNPYPFGWDDISTDNKEFMKFLEDELLIKLAEDAKIKKSDNEINISDEENTLNFIRKGNEVTLKISGGKTHKYILKEKDGKEILYPYPCNVLPHPCSKSDRILTHIKVISKEKHYGIMYKLIGLKNVNERISYLEEPVVSGNFTKEYNWKLFLLSNSSALKLDDPLIKELKENAEEKTKTFRNAVVVEGTVYDKDANPVKGAYVGIYLAGIEPHVIHIATITDDKGRFKIYHEPAAIEKHNIYRLPKIQAFIPKDNWDVVYDNLPDYVDMSLPPKKYPEVKEYPFPVLLTLIVSTIVGAILVLFGTGYLDKMVDAMKGRKKEEHEQEHKQE